MPVCTNEAEAETVAVLVAVYENDNENWFEQSILSIVNQSYCFKNIKIYLGVDGPVCENMEKRIDYLNQYFYKVIRNKKNIGLTKTLNRLIEELEGEKLIFRMDADDLCFHDRFAKQVDFLRYHPEIDVLGGSIIEIDSNGNTIFEKNYPLKNDGIINMIHRANPLAHVSTCYRIGFINEINGYPDDVKYNQDLALWFYGLKKGYKFANIPDILVAVRVNDEFYRRRSFKRAFGEMKIYLHGIYGLEGISYKLIYPLARFCFRLFPLFLIKIIYSSSIRRRLSS